MLSRVMWGGDCLRPSWRETLCGAAPALWLARTQLSDDHLKQGGESSDDHLKNENDFF